MSEKMERFFWEQITNARNFTDQAARALLDGKGALLQFPAAVPWYGSMVAAIQEKVMKNTSDKVFDFLESPEADIGKFLLDKYCKIETKRKYRPRPGMTEATFLAQMRDIVFHERFIWVKNANGHILDEWLDFLDEYYKNLPPREKAAVFILENRSSQATRRPPRLEKISFEAVIRTYDVHTICTFLSADVPCRDAMREYLADLAANLCQTDLELCERCLNREMEFLRSPAAICMEEARAMGRDLGNDKEQEKYARQLERMVWETQLKNIFPILENRRIALIEKYRAGIEKRLPIDNPGGDDFKEPMDVELQTLYYLNASGQLNMDERDASRCAYLRQCRNLLAHLTALEAEDVEALL